jgi:Restriction endonuclease
MALTNFEKGRAWERAVGSIQEAILKADQKLERTDFTIDFNQRIVVEGVPHEIDVLVKTFPGAQYEAILIFECKNWRKPVGKEKVVNLSETVRAMGASRGFLVAKSLTKGAQAQMKQDCRLAYIPCTDEFLSPLDESQLMHVCHEPAQITLHVNFRGVSPSEHPSRLEWPVKASRLNGAPIDLQSLAMQQVERLVREDREKNFTKYQEEGTHWGDLALRTEFDCGELMIDNLDVEHIELLVRFFVNVQRHKVISKFELKNQGRVFSLEPLENIIAGKDIQVAIVQRV